MIAKGLGAAALLVALFQPSLTTAEPSERATEASADEAAVLMFERYLDMRDELMAHNEPMTTDEGHNLLFQPDIIVTPSAPDDIYNPSFPSDPSDGGSYIPPYFPGYSSRTTGAAYIVAMETLYQTLMFYGVTHVVNKKGTRVDFEIIESKRGFFVDLTRTEISFALREFARYLIAHMCGDATPEKFYSMFTQVPAEEIGLRFKYDMAWALLGNSLPKDANEIYAMGKKWKLLSSAVNSVPYDKKSEEGKEIKNVMTMLTDVVKFMTELNRLTCYVDIRPKPRQELKKRIVIKKLLVMQRDILNRYDKYQDILDAMKEKQKEEEGGDDSSDDGFDPDDMFGDPSGLYSNN